jgi:hypothetical protein
MAYGRPESAVGDQATDQQRTIVFETVCPDDEMNLAAIEA